MIKRGVTSEEEGEPGVDEEAGTHTTVEEDEICFHKLYINYYQTYKSLFSFFVHIKKSS